MFNFFKKKDKLLKADNAILIEIKKDDTIQLYSGMEKDKVIIAMEMVLDNLYGDLAEGLEKPNERIDYIQ